MIRRCRFVLTLTVAATIALSGCAAGGESGAASTPSPTPTAACPRLDDVPDAERDCAVYDPDAAMAENERYREQMPVDPATQADLDSYVEPARAALEALAPPASVEDVIAALASVGLDESSIQTSDHGTGIAFGALASGGCVTGSVSLDGAVTVQAGGLIMDGGCLAADGH
ncbi:hypothetical protein [Labedella endophytica]|uniref:Uncharacterized protein n=1 Tax=Labedella endophytica TaxID=1523160 RepID=A0A433JNY5_9MICO|nr:hypothetical protein [Labedella endophytica]RUQ98175.1 hypothetical protein ELQ94_14230 [Labedella endophytica]